MNTPYRVSEEMLGMSSAAQGLGGMVSKVRPGANRFSGGGMDKVEVNSQPYNNERYYEQNIMQNTLSAAPQAASGAMGNVRSEAAAATDAEQKAQQLVTTRMSEVLYANQSGNALMRLNSVMQSPEKGKFLNDIAVGKAMAQGLNPDLGQEVAQARQYG